MCSNINLVLPATELDFATGCVDVVNIPGVRPPNQVHSRVELHQEFAVLRHVPDVLGLYTCLWQGVSILKSKVSVLAASFASHLNLDTSRSGEADVDGVSQDSTTLSKDFCSNLLSRNL